MAARRNPHQQKHYRALCAIAWGAADAMRKYFATLSDKQLKQADSVLQNLSTTNCSWPIYQMRELLRGVMHDEALARKPPKDTA